MVQWPKPTTIKGLRGFLELTEYYRKFGRGYRAIANPLTNMLKNNNFQWSEEAEKAFETLKLAMCTISVLPLPNFDKPFIIETDACYGGVGVVLMQDHRPISYISKAFSKKNMGLSIYEKELLALVLAISKWGHYLEGNYFIIRNDHQSLKFLLGQRITMPMQQKWLTKLLGLNYEIQY